MVVIHNKTKDFSEEKCKKLCESGRVDFRKMGGDKVLGKINVNNNSLT